MYENTRVVGANNFVLQPIVKRFVVAYKWVGAIHILHFLFYAARAGRPFVTTIVGRIDPNT